ncbi:MAG: HAAS signaling domain-containing protein [Oscillospiraceae bacterium]|jgi:hypothetical protein
MSNLIERYIYAVAKRLPEDIREDVKRELRSNFEDMLSDNPGEEEIKNLLQEMGSPSKLALKYHPNPRYLISPEIFDDYMTVLKIVAITLAALTAGLAVFKVVFGISGNIGVPEMAAKIIVSFLSSAFSGVVQAFFFVTIVFFCVEYFGKSRGPGPWNPKDLPEVPTNSKTIIKRGDTIANAVFSILFTALFLIGTLRRPQFFAWYEAGLPTAPLFSEEVVRQFLPFYLLIIALTLFMMVYKLIKGRWTIGVAAAQSLFSIINIIIGISFITRPDVITGEFIARFAGKLKIAGDTVSDYIHTGFTVIIVLMILGMIVEIVSAFVNAMKSYKNCE